MSPDYAPGSPQDWLNRAKGKLVLARQRLPEGAYWQDLTYMAQQAAELAIKAVYCRKGLQFAFVHDIRFLLDGLVKTGLEVPEQVREAERLTVFATQMRYPGTSEFITEKLHERMLAIAETVVAWADSLVNS